MRFLLLVISLNAFIVIHAQNPPPVFSASFSLDTLRVKEKAVDTTYYVSIQVKNTAANPVIVTISDAPGSTEQTASLADYTFRSPVQLSFSENTPLQISLPLVISKDDYEDQNERIKLVLTYTLPNQTVPVRDSLWIYIYDDSKAIQEEVKSDQKISISKNVTVNNIAFQSVIQEKVGGHTLRTCKLRSDDPSSASIPEGNDSCSIQVISVDYSRADFRSVFLDQYERLGANSKANADYLTAQADALFDRWKTKVAEPGAKEAESKAAKELKEAADEIRSALKIVLQSRRDTGFAQIRAALTSVPLYKRVLPAKSKTVKEGGEEDDRYADPIGDMTNTYSYEETEKKIEIDSMSIRFYDGFITNLTIYPSDDSRRKFNLNKTTVIRKYFDMRSSLEAAENLNIYLPLESQSRNYKPKRFSPSGTVEPARIIRYEGSFINLYDILKYYPIIDSIGDVLLHVKNRNLSFSRRSDNVVKLQDKDFNSFAQLNIYTDVVGFTEDKPNGLIQLEGKFETSVFAQPLFNSSYYSKVKFRLLPSACLSFTWRKIENKLKYLTIPKDSVLLFNNATNIYDSFARSKRYITSIQLLQFSSLDVSARFNLVSVETDYTALHAYGGVGIIRTPINDTTQGTDSEGRPIVSDNRTIVNSLKLFYGVKAKLKSTSRLGVELGMEYIRLRFNNNAILQTYNEYDDVGRKNVIKEVRLQKVGPQIFSPNGHIYYFLDRDHQNRIYARAQYFMNIKSKTDDFFSLQIGYSTDLGGLFKALGGEK